MNSDLLKIGNQTVFFKSSETMKEIKNDSIDVIVTSPPYNRGKKYSSDDNRTHNDNLPESEYLSFLERVWRECFRVCQKKGVFFLNIGDSALDQGISEKVATTAVRTGWTRIQDIIWVKSIYGKGHYTPSGGDKRFNNVWEHIFMFVKNPNGYKLDTKAIGIPYADKSNIGRYGNSDLRDPGNVWHICYEKTTGATIKKGHEAPFPIGLPYKCIKSIPDARTVLDPFLGTGTTLAATNSLGVRGFGYEKYPRKDLIKNTIIQGNNYEPQSVILIPHMELTIQKLLSILNVSKIDLKNPRSKKESLDLSIVLDTLKKMNLKNEFINKLLKILSENDYYKLITEGGDNTDNPIRSRKLKKLDEFMKKSR
ncbi:MAG: DNA-methyltransferase [Promethearchaeota archaeon]